MLFRLLFVFGSIVLFIGGCNGVISKNFGTHKLRNYTMEQVVLEGIGDADFIAVEQAYLPGDFAYAAPKNGRGKGILQYPVTLASAEKTIKIVAWSRIEDTSCVEQQNCIKKGTTNLKGIIRKIGRERNRIHSFVEKGYSLNEPIIYMEVDRSPLAWYWNLLMMVIAVALFLFLEGRRLNKA